MHVLVVWTKENNEELQNLDNSWYRDVDLWFLQVKYGYIIEFSIGSIESYSRGEEKFEVGPRKRFLDKIPLC